MEFLCHVFLCRTFHSNDMTPQILEKTCFLYVRQFYTIFTSQFCPEILVYKFRVMKYEKRAMGWLFQDKFYFVCQTFCCKNMTLLILGQF
jgi:hypothetical protein